MIARASLAFAVCALLGCGGDGAPAVGSEITGCDGAKLVQPAADRSARGPWEVGAKTVTVDGLTTEVWYPAAPGSIGTLAPARYDIRLQLPETEAAKISDADNPWQDCDCYRDVPLDEAHGPYPVIVFVHGTAAFRHQSLSIVTHWVSRGYVVIAADHPGLVLGDLLAQACGGSPPPQNIAANLDSLFTAVASPAGELSFLAGHVAADRIAVTGHSAGANAAADASTRAGVRAVVAMAGNRSTQSSAQLGASLYMSGTSDSVVSQGQVKTAWSGAAAPRTYVALEGAGHLAFSDLCETKNAAGDDLITIAQKNGVCGAQLASFLFDCSPDLLDGPSAWTVIDDVSTAILANQLQCQAMPDLGDTAARFAQVAEYAEAN